MAVTRHYHTLDGMRGVAALLVVGMHAQILLAPISVPHAYLAVDLFFALSGLVIAHAYGERLDAGLGVGRFMLLRYVRLYPLYLAGTLVGIGFFLVTTHGGRRVDLVPGDVAVAIGSALLMLPSPVAPAARDWLMPFNVAAWSLIFELGVNLLLVLAWKRLTNGLLGAVIAASAGVMVAQTLAHGTADIGVDWPTAWMGVSRTILSFSIGIAIHRLRGVVPVRSRWAALLPAALIPIAMAPAEIGPGFDLLCILVLFPAMIVAGRMVEPVSARGYAWLGLISYALYALHNPLLPVISTLFKFTAYTPASVAPLGGLALLVLLALLAWTADRAFDTPVRRWLGKRLGLRRPSRPLAGPAIGA